MLRTLSLAILLAVSGCATTTQIISDPPGATVYDDGGKELGTTPLAFTHEGWLWEKANVELRKAGYQDKKVEIKRSDPHIVPLVAGGATAFFCSWTVIGFFGGIAWILADGLGFPAETQVALEAAKAAQVAPSPVAIKPEDE